MARYYALNSLKRQKRSSFRFVRKDAKYPDGKLVPENKKSWHSGRIAGLKAGERAFYAGKKSGYSEGRKIGYRSGLRNGRMFANTRRYCY